MKLQILLAVSAFAASLFLGVNPVSAQSGSSDDDTQGGQSQQDQPSQPDEQDQANEQQSQRQSDQTDQRRSQQRDDETTEYRGSERAALGVMLSEGRDGAVSISQVIPESPAQQAGIRRGDRISKIDNEEVNSYRDVIRAINRKKPDDKVEITVQRDGEEEQMNVSLESRGDVFRQQQQSSQRQSRGQYDDRSDRGQDQRRTDRGQQPTYDPSQQSRRQADDRFRQQTDGRGQWQQDRGRFADGRQRQYQERSFQDERRYQGQQDRPYGQYGRNRYEQSQLTRRDDRQQDDRYGDQYSRQSASQRDRVSRRQSDRPTLGIGIRSDGRDLWVSEVYRDSPAEDAGLRDGDQIIAVEGRQVRSYDQLLATLDRHDAGDQVTLEIARNGRRQQIKARLQEADSYARGGQSWQQQRSGQDRQRVSDDRDRWNDRQRYDRDEEQRTGDSGIDAGRKLTADPEPYDGDFDYVGDGDF